MAKILTVIAWDDRPEVRRKDIDDIELDEIASQFLGREIGKIISGNPKLVERINGILENGLNDANDLAELFTRESYQTIEYSKSLISHIQKGVEEVTSRSK